MKVILMASVPKLGRAGDITSVADGYARNYLLPNRLAVLATPTALRAQEASRGRQAREAQRQASQAAATRQRLDGRRFTLQVKTNQAGTLFAGITSAVLTDFLTTQGYPVSAEAVSGTPIKHVGEHRVRVNFGTVGTATITIVVAPSL